jgi:ubiquitin C-terminal hydrolase
MTGDSIRRRYLEKKQKNRCLSQLKVKNTSFQENFGISNNTPFNQKGDAKCDDKIRNQKESQGTKIDTTYIKKRGFKPFRIKEENVGNFSILSIKEKKEFSLWKNNFSLFSVTEKTEKNKNNESSFLTQETSENLNFSLISNISSSSKKENTQIKESKNKQKFIELPDKPKGLYNFSLNCYMNSLLQCFYHIKGLRTSFIDPKQFSEETQKVCHSLSEVMKGLTYGDNYYYSPNNFKQTLGDINSLFAGCKGADVSDLYRTVVDSIIDEIPFEYPEDDEDYENKKKIYEDAKKEVDPNNPINKELNYFYETIYRCPTDCNIYSVQNDSSIIFDLLKISKITNGTIDLKKCFDYYFREIQNNEFYCSKCNCTHKSTSRDKLLSLPKVLTIILNRGKGKQFVDEVEFGETINIQKYVDDTFIKPKNRKFNYKLIGVSTHLGSSSNCGHYIAYCYREKEKKYFCFNDERARMISFEELKNGEPYILFYEQMDDITTPK